MTVGVQLLRRYCSVSLGRGTPAWARSIGEAGRTRNSAPGHCHGSSVSYTSFQQDDPCVGNEPPSKACWWEHEVGTCLQCLSSKACKACWVEPRGRDVLPMPVIKQVTNDNCAACKLAGWLATSIHMHACAPYRVAAEFMWGQHIAFQACGTTLLTGLVWAAYQKVHSQPAAS